MRSPRSRRVRILTPLVAGIAAITPGPLLAAATGWSGPASAAPAEPASPGYWLLGEDGGVFSFNAPFEGSAASSPSQCPPNTVDRFRPNGTCVAMAGTTDGRGYWILNGDTNRIFAFGDAGFFGQPADQLAGVSREFVPTGVSMTPTPDGMGYWVLELPLSGAAQVRAFGDATFFGDTTGTAINGSPVGITRTPDGRGYWVVASDGGVFAFGDAGFFGSMGARRLSKPVVGMAPTPDGRGYWLVAGDGGVFAFGDAAFAGSMGGKPLNAAMVGMAANPNGAGYWIAAGDGGIFAFGGAPFAGSMGGRALAAPIVGMAALP
jgi:hypothetical protein